MASNQKRRTQNTAIDEINMTPLIDLTFLLLIVFIVTVPLMEYTTDVSPPEMNADKIDEDKNSVTVGLDKDGRMSFKKEIVDKEGLASRLQAAFLKNKNLNVYIRGDGSRPYKEVIELMKIVKSVGFKNVSLITIAEDNTGGRKSGGKK